MSVHKTDQGTYRARVRDHAGKQVTRTFKLKADADAWERSMLVQRDAGIVIGRNDKTSVSDWCDLWLGASRNLAPATIRTYRRDLDFHILPVLGPIPLGRLSAANIDDYLTAQIDRGVAPSTVHRHYRTIRRFCQVAVERQRIPRNPCDAVKPPRIPYKEMRFLTAEQIETLASNIGDRYRSWVLVAAYGGLRWGEMLALRPQDFTGNTLDVRAQLVQEPDGWERVPTKSRAGVRRVELPDSVSEELRYHLDVYPADTIFTNKDLNPMTRASFTGNVFKPALVKSRIDRDTRIHDLRHSCVALLVACGAHPKTIQVRLGHASIAVTLDTYGHLFPDLDSTAAVDLDVLRTAAR
jgi:integrase